MNSKANLVLALALTSVSLAQPAFASGRKTPDFDLSSAAGVYVKQSGSEECPKNLTLQTSSQELSAAGIEPFVSINDAKGVAAERFVGTMKLNAGPKISIQAEGKAYSKLKGRQLREAFQGEFGGQKFISIRTIEFGAGSFKYTHTASTPALDKTVNLDCTYSRTN